MRKNWPVSDHFRWLRWGLPWNLPEIISSIRSMENSFRQQLLPKKCRKMPWQWNVIWDQARSKASVRHWRQGLWDVLGVRHFGSWRKSRNGWQRSRGSVKKRREKLQRRFLRRLTCEKQWCFCRNMGFLWISEPKSIRNMEKQSTVYFRKILTGLQMISVVLVSRLRTRSLTGLESIQIQITESEAGWCILFCRHQETDMYIFQGKNCSRGLRNFWGWILPIWKNIWWIFL